MPDSRHFLHVRYFYLLAFIFLIQFVFLAFPRMTEKTGSLVPYDKWFSSFFGVSLSGGLDWERNNFDRIVRFSYGLLLAYPIREIYCRVADAEGFWGYFQPFDFTMPASMLYKLFDWLAAEVSGGELGAVYLGTQSDVWDAH